MLTSTLKNKNRARGFTLIEVLIAMFILSVGMLGSTSLMLQGRAEAKRTNYDAKAMQMAQSIAEQMRANIAGVNNGSYNSLDTSNGTSQSCITTSCTSAQLALYDEYIWGWMLNQYLPKGTGTVTGNGADSVFTIAVTWQEVVKTGEDATGPTGVAQDRTYTMVFQP